MKIIILILLSTLMQNLQLVSACDAGSNCDNCCENSGCTSSCEIQSSCCNTCEKRCRTTNCANTCRQNCCRPYTTTPSPITLPTPEPRSGAGYTSNNNNNNNDSVVGIFTINNVVNTENRIHIPVTINSENVQSVVITSAQNTSSFTNKECGVNTTCPPTTTPAPCTSVTCSPGKENRIPVPIPVPFPMPVPIFIQTPVPRPIPNCCVLVTPCVNPQCQPYRHVCGHGCTGGYLYDRRNPCEYGCHKRTGFSSQSCDWSGQCHDRYNDCGHCQQDSFNSFEGYQRCGGCFYR